MQPPIVVHVGNAVKILAVLVAKERRRVVKQHCTVLDGMPDADPVHQAWIKIGDDPLLTDDQRHKYRHWIDRAHRYFDRRIAASKKLVNAAVESDQRSAYAGLGGVGINGSKRDPMRAPADKDGNPHTFRLVRIRGKRGAAMARYIAD